MIRLDNISMTFHQGTVNENEALKNIDLTVNEGDFITIIGSNGAGKTTLYNIIAGTVTPTSGRILIRGKDVTTMPEYKRARNIGRIFQDPTLGTASNMSIEDNMMISYKKGFKGLSISLNSRMRAFFHEQLKALDMGLEDRMKDNVGLLSGGQRQALTLLMMVLSKPDLILLDEHIAALDPRNAELVMKLTMRFIEEFGLTTMMITHNMALAIEYGNRLLMMDEGEIILDIQGEEKKRMTVEKLVHKFKNIRKKTLANDEILLSEQT